MGNLYHLHAPFVAVFLLFAVGFAIAHRGGEKR
jgi:hypothetical protein